MLDRLDLVVDELILSTIDWENICSMLEQASQSNEYPNVATLYDLARFLQEHNLYPSPLHAQV